MTPAERAYRLALLAYPASYRRERGLEILTTILDGGDGRWPRAREIAAVVADGVKRRGRIAGGGSRAGLLRAGVRLAVFAWLWPLAVIDACRTLYPAIGAEWIGGGADWWRAGVSAALSLAAIWALARSWWYGPLGVQIAGAALGALGVPFAVTWPWQVTGHVGQASAIFALGFVPGVACALATPRAGEPDDARSVLWVPGAVAFGALLAWQGLFYSSWLGRPMAVFLMGSLLLARRDPRLAAAALGVALLASATRIAAPSGYDPTWLGGGSLFTAVLAAYAVAALWRLRPVAAT
jgi:hypothetical protein